MSTFDSSHNADSPGMEDLNELASAMREGLKERIKDRTHRLRTYRRCFTGRTGVRWLVQNGHAADPVEAVSVGNALLQAGLLHHVAFEHTFKDSDLLYKFVADDQAGAMIRDLARPSSGLASSGNSAAGQQAVPLTPLSDRAASEKSHMRPKGSSGHHTHQTHHAHRALLNAQIHTLNHKLERLASQHASLVAVNAQQQEVWEAQASGELREIKDTLRHHETVLEPTQMQMMQLTVQIAQLQGQLSSHRTLAAAQQLVLALALVAVGSGWAPAGLWAIAAAALGSSLAATLLGRETSSAPRLPAPSCGAPGARPRRLPAAAGGGAPAAIAGTPAEALARDYSSGGKAGAGGAAALRVLAAASEGSEDAPPPMSAVVEQLLVGRVIGGKAVDDTAPAIDEFANWPDGGMIMRPSPKSADLAVTRVERYQSEAHVAIPTEVHRRWEAAQRRWRPRAGAATAAAARPGGDAGASGRDQDAEEDEEEGSRGESWVPAPAAGLPVNHYVLHFESDLFVGKLLLYIKGLPSSYEPYFAGKKRRSVVMMQGRFKRPLAVKDVVMGQEFARPYKNLRGCWLMEKVVLAFAKRVVSAMETGDMSQEPFITFPLLPLAHVVNVSLPGQEPPIDQPYEDLRLWDPSLVNRSGGPMASDARRRHFMMDKNRQGRQFSTEHVWTFCIWQQVIDVAGCYLDLLVQQYDSIQHLDGQPLQTMIKDKSSGKYLFNMLHWNKRQIEDTLRQKESRRVEEEAAAAKRKLP